MALQKWTWFEFTPSNVNQVPDFPGVYMLADPPITSPTVWYVGQSGAVQSRLGQHLGETENVCIRRHLQRRNRVFCYKLVPGGERARLEEEARLLQERQPECNA